MTNKLWSITGRALISAGCLLVAMLYAGAAELPSPERLSSSVGEPVNVSVFEPNLSQGEEPVAIEYVAYPAVEIFALVLGEDWRSRTAAIELRALDGYISRIESSRFDSYPAYLAFARADGADFSVDVPSQNQTDVPLGPYYLIWDNRQHPELLPEGGRYWPYQVDRIEPFYGFGDILTPATLEPEYLEGARLAQDHCLTCHQIRGVGGELLPIDLALVARAYQPDQFSRWLLEPSAVNPGTNMPPLRPQSEQQERERMARAIYDYLRQLQ
jgi:mono/diheme cytochrome c family protein